MKNQFHVFSVKPSAWSKRMKSLPSKTLLLCFVLLQASFAALATNISGSITCGGKGVPGVVVSDGYAFATTNAQGHYAITSDKKNGYVFYIIPSGYMPKVDNDDWSERLFGGFWQPLIAHEDKPSDETHDFVLQKEKNDKHIMVFEADPQLANRKDTRDMEQYERLFLPRIKQEAQKAGRTPIYSTVLGDLSWDCFWYRRNFSIADYKNYITKNHSFYSMRHFCVTGNHDNNPSVLHSDSTDFLASASFRQAVGPNYYSYNIGQVHYVVLDDIIYENRPSKSGKYDKGVVGMRDYEAGLTDDQLAWLAKDLSYVDPGTPVFVSLHIPVWVENGDFEVVPRQKYNNTSIRLCQALSKFKTVHIMSGHRHQCYNMLPEQFPNIMEHSLGAVGGNLWASGAKTGHPTCADGTPGGYQVFTINGKNISWQLRTLEGTGNEQMRVIDGNTVKAFFSTNPTWQAIVKTYHGRQDFSTLPDNTVLVNVFNYDKAWKVRIFEDGRELPVKRIKCEDPYATMSYDIPMFKKKGAYGDGNATRANTHMFSAVASKPNGKITVKVTDRFGRTYTSVKQLPIACTIEALAPSGK